MTAAQRQAPHPLLHLAVGLGLSGCPGTVASPPQDAARYGAALKALAREPASAARLCAEIVGDGLRADCITAGAERLAVTDVPGAAALCAGLAEGLGRDECHFQVAERSGEASHCVYAGRFAEDCQMHAWTRSMMGMVDKQASFSEAVTALRPQAALAGFSPDDPRPWIAAFRHLHGLHTPLDRGRCAGLEGTIRVPCEDAAVMLLHDRISHARDTGGWVCGRGPPASLEIAEDGVLMAILDKRRAEVCP